MRSNTLILTGKALQVRVFVLHSTFNLRMSVYYAIQIPGQKEYLSFLRVRVQSAPTTYKALPLTDIAACEQVLI